MMTDTVFKLLQLDQRISSPQDEEVGIEIEFEGRNLVPRSHVTGWAFTRDGSLRTTDEHPEAVEIRFDRPRFVKEVPILLAGLRQALEDNKAVIADSGRCGIHVHVNCQNMTFNQVMCFSLLYLIFEEALVRFSGPSREDNLFCLRAKDSPAIVDALYMAWEGGSPYPLVSNGYRYSSINHNPLSTFGSVEFRSLATRSSYVKDILNWVELLIRVRDASRKFETPRQIVEALSGMGGRQFSQEVFHDSLELIDWPGLEISVMDGVRLIQDIAFMPPRQQPAKPKKKTSSDTTNIDVLLRGLDRNRFVMTTGRPEGLFRAFPNEPTDPEG